MRRLIQKKQYGFTFVELILYMGLVSIFVTAAVIFGWNVILSGAKSNAQQELSQAMRFASERIGLEVRGASSINSLSATSLSLESPDSSRNPTVIDLDSGRIRIGWGVSGLCTAASPCPLTPADITVSSLTFTDLSQGGSQNIQFEFTGEFTGDRSEFQANQTITSSSELRSE